MLMGVTSFGCALHRPIHTSFVTTAHRAGEWRSLLFFGCRSLVWPRTYSSFARLEGIILFCLYALFICDHCPPPHSQGNVEDFDFKSADQVPVLTTTLWGQLADKNMTVLSRSLLLYCTAMVAYVFKTPTFPLHYGDNRKVKSLHICHAIPTLLRGLGEAVVTNNWCMI